MVGAMALSAFFALAGCSAPFAGEAAPTETRTLTPAPVPEGATATPEGTGYPPEVGPDGVTDAERLGVAHEAALANTSHTVRLSTRRERADGTLEAVYERVVRVESPERFHYALTARSDGGERRIERWRSGETGFGAVTTDGNTTYRRLDAPWPPQLVTRSELVRVFELDPSTLAGTRDRNGTTLYRLEGGPGEVSGLSNVGYVAVVTQSGLVQSYSVSYDVADGNRTLSVTVTARFEAVGETTVERPPWYDEAV